MTDLMDTSSHEYQSVLPENSSSERKDSQLTHTSVNVNSLDTDSHSVSSHKCEHLSGEAPGKVPTYTSTDASSSGEAPGLLSMDTTPLQEKKKPWVVTDKSFLGKGNYAHIYLCEDRKHVAKCIRSRSDDIGELGIQVDFLHELSMRTYLGEEVDQVFLEDAVFTLPLMRKISTKHSISISKIKPVIWQLLSHLHKLHSKGVIHADISDLNIMITTEGKYQLIDMGICCFSETNAFSRGCGGYVEEGTTSWTLPSLTTDIYALGRTFLCLMGFSTGGDIASKTRRTQWLMNYYCMPQDLADFISCMLDPQVARRFTTTQLLSHKFLADVKVETPIANAVISESKNLPKRQKYILDPRIVGKLKFEKIIMWLVRDICECAKLNLACCLNALRMLKDILQKYCKVGNIIVPDAAMCTLLCLSCLNISYKVIAGTVIDIKTILLLANKNFVEDVFWETEKFIIKLLKFKLHFPPFSLGKHNPYTMVTWELSDEIVAHEMSDVEDITITDP